METPQNKTHATVTGSGGSWRKYSDVMIGSRSVAQALRYEGCGWLAGFPGAAGLFLRNVFWPSMFGSCGRGVQFGQGIIVRHPHRIHIGNRVVFSERCVLDARSPDEDRAIVIEDDVMLSVGAMLSCKGGRITIGAHVGVGPGTTIHSMTGEPVAVGRDAIIGPACFITGGGSYHTDRIDVPIRLQGKRLMGGSTVEEDVWLGARCTVLGGVTLGRGSIVGAGAVVKSGVPPLSVCVGVPARVIRRRGPGAAEAPA